MRISTIILFLVLFLTNSIGQQKILGKRKYNVNRQLKETLACPGFKTAALGFYAVDINSGEVISGLNINMALKPASTLKLLTTATALELMGPDYKFETLLEYTGEIDTMNHFLNGDIIIKGGGDPALGSKYFDTTGSRQFLINWLEAVRELGIDSIGGRIIADAGIFSLDIVPPSWSWQNMGNYYGAGPCGLSIYDNYYSVFFNTGNIAGTRAEITGLYPCIPGLVFDNTVTADSISWDDAYIFGAPYSYYRYIRGRLPLNKTEFKVKGSMPDPALVAARELDSVLAMNGIGIKYPAATMRLIAGDSMVAEAAKVFYVTKSPSLAMIVEQTNTHSINLFAEHCLIHSGIRLGSLPETVSSADSVISFWAAKGMDTQGLSLHDGSGLSQYNTITPFQMVYLLSYMKLNSSHYEDFYNSLPVAGETGTLENMFKGSVAEGQLRAKSGTINRVKAYAGYVKSVSGREIAFSMVVNNFSCSSDEARAKLEQLMLSLAEFDR